MAAHNLSPALSLAHASVRVPRAASRPRAGLVDSAAADVRHDALDDTEVDDVVGGLARAWYAPPDAAEVTRA